MSSSKEITPRQSAAAFSALAPLADLLKSGEFSDLKIISNGGRVFQVHRNIVCPRSKPFKAMVTRDWSAAATGEIRLEDDDEELVHMMLKFLYTGSYLEESDLKVPSVMPNTQLSGGDDHRPSKRQKLLLPQGNETEPTITPSSNLLSTHARVYILADKWDIPDLRAFSANEYEEALSPKRLEESSPDEDLIKHFVESMKIIYDNTRESDRRLRDVALKLAWQNRCLLNVRPDYLSLLKEDNDFAVDYVQFTVNCLPWAGEDKYHNCLQWASEARYDLCCGRCNDPIVCSSCSARKGFNIPNIDKAPIKNYANGSTGHEVHAATQLRCSSCRESSTVGEKICLSHHMLRNNRVARKKN